MISCAYILKLYKTMWWNCIPYVIFRFIFIFGLLYRFIC